MITKGHAGLLALALALVTLLAPGAGAQERMTIAVMEFKGMAGVSQEKADVLMDIMAGEIASMGYAKVITKSDINAMLNLEKQKRLAGCDSKECLADITGALGVDWMVTGNIGRLGDIYVLNLKLVDVRSARVPGRVSKRITGGEEEILDELLDATRELFEKMVGRVDHVPSVTVASRRPQVLAESPSAVTVFTREDIRSSGAVVLTDFLRRVPGFDVYEIKPTFAVAGARALTEEIGNLVLLLIDGREALVELTGFPIWTGLTVDMEEIERIEVIRGPGSTLYGSNAFSAVVNITTIGKTLGEGSEVYMTVGEYDFFRMNGTTRHHWSLGDGVLYMSASLGNQYKRSPLDDERLNYLRYRTHGVVGYREGTDLDLSLRAGSIDAGGKFHTHVGDMRVYPLVQYWVMGKGSFDLGRDVRLNAQTYFTHYRAGFKARSSLRAFDVWIADFPEFTTTSPVADGQLQLDIPVSDALLLIAGANVRYAHIYCDTFDPRDVNELRGAGYVHIQWAPWSKLQLTGGLRLDLSSEINPALSPRTVAVLRPWPNHAFRLGYGLAFRKPSLYESQVHLAAEDYNPAVPEIVDKLTESLGNEELTNEKVHSFEAGWRGWMLDERLQVSVDLFFNIYMDVITFEVDLEERLGLPDIRNSIIQFENDPEKIYALGGETEVRWRAGGSWFAWGNLGVRRVTHRLSGKRLSSEPALKINGGFRYAPEEGFSADVALHYVSSYTHSYPDPNNLLQERLMQNLGETVLLVGRIGYRACFGEGPSVDIGLRIRTPLGRPFREFPGVPMSAPDATGSKADWGGELFARLAILYLRLTF